MSFVQRVHTFEKKVLFGHFQELEHRLVDLKNKADARYHRKSDHEELLEKIRPKLELINRRLSEVVEDGDNKSSGSLKSIIKAQEENDTNKLAFDARLVFDVLDADASGDVTFDELNVILGLNCLELGEFVRRMNELAGVTDKEKMTAVTRPVFVKYFLQVLKDTANLTVTFEEAEELYNEMATNGRAKLDAIHMSKFYTSSMSDFLSDIQILDLIKVRMLID
jgi:Ca2+-binding EF-hand superfamily protein